MGRWPAQVWLRRANLRAASHRAPADVSGFAAAAAELWNVRRRKSRHGISLRSGLKIPVPLNVREVTRLIEEDGWRRVRTTGSHRQFRHPSKPGLVTVAGKPSLDIPPGTQKSSFKQAGLKGR